MLYGKISDAPAPLNAELQQEVNVVNTGGGTTNYNLLSNKPSINDVELVGNKTSEELGLASANYVDTKVADLVNSAPETLDTLGEVARAIEENADVVDALNSAIGSKADKTELADYVKNTDYPTDSKAGIVKAWESGGIGINSTNGNIYLAPANNQAITNRTPARAPITVENMDFAFVQCLTNNANTLADEEKANAQSWLGVPQIELTLKDNGAYTLTIIKG